MPSKKKVRYIPRRELVIVFAAIMAIVILGPSVGGNGTPSSGNLNSAKLDLSIFYYLVDSSVGQINGYLENSYLGLDPNGDTSVDEHELTDHFKGDHEAQIKTGLAQAKWNQTKLAQSLNDAGETKEQILDVAQSHQYLEEILQPFNAMKTNITLHCDAHEGLVNALINLTKLYLGTKPVSESRTAMSIINITRSIGDLEAMKESHQDIGSNLLDLGKVTLDGKPFKPNGLDEVAPKLEVLEGQYEYYHALIDFFTLNLVVDEPSLILELDKDSFYLKEEMNGKGYFITGTPLEDSLSATISLNGDPLQSAFTNTLGFFTFSLGIPLDTPLGEMNLTADLGYLGEAYSSAPILVPVEKIPVHIALSADRMDLSRNETLEIRGKVTDHYNDPFGSGLLNLDLAMEQYPLITSQDGEFQLEVDCADLEFGYQLISAEFPETTYHNSSDASIFFRINIETVLTVELKDTTLEVGDTLRLTGALSAVDGEMLDDKEVILYVDGEAQDTLITDDGAIETGVSFDTTGKHHIHLEYISDAPRLRNATTDPLAVDVRSQTTGFNLPLPDNWPFLLVLMILIVLVGLLTLFIVVRRIGLNWRKRGHVSSIAKPEGKKPETKSISQKPEPRPSEELVAAILEDAGIVDLETLSTEQEAVVLQYQVFLKYVQRKGRVDVGSLTPNEIRRSLRGTSIPPSSVNKITKIFNSAFYTRTQVTAKDVGAMVDEVDRITGGGRS